MIDNDSISAESGLRKKPFILFRMWQWAVAAFLALMIMPFYASIDKLSLPGAPVTQFWIGLAAVVLITILHSPPVFFRLPNGMKLSSYAAIVPAFIVFLLALVGIDEAYKKTPEGARQAAARAEDEKMEGLQRAEREAEAAKLREAEALVKRAQELNEKLESCFSTFGHRLPALERQVRNSLENPHAFEHVETVAIEPDAEGYDVAMQFRAENGFGALRTAIVKAKVVPETCEINEVSEPEL